MTGMTGRFSSPFAGTGGVCKGNAKKNAKKKRKKECEKCKFMVDKGKRG